jgi:hypothetical protein
MKDQVVYKGYSDWLCSAGSLTFSKSALALDGAAPAPVWDVG